MILSSENLRLQTCQKQSQAMSLILKSSNKQRIPKHKRLLNEDIHKSQWEESKIHITLWYYDLEQLKNINEKEEELKIFTRSHVEPLQ